MFVPTILTLIFIANFVNSTSCLYVSSWVGQKLILNDTFRKMESEKFNVY